MGERIRTFDWASTPLGPIEGWPNSLQTALGLILNAQMPMWIGWGPDCTFFYNDAYIQVLGEAKHQPVGKPGALGQPASVVWSEIWHVCGPLVDMVFQKAEAPFVEDVRLFMNRGALLEEVYYSFSYSPIRDEQGRVAGLFCPNTEVTSKLLHARRLRTLSELSARALVEKMTASACASVAGTLEKNPDDLPFVLLYLTDADQGLRLEQAVRVSPGTALSPRHLASEETLVPWDLFSVLQSGALRIVNIPPNGVLPRGLADQPVVRAVILPVAVAGHDRPLGVMVAGVNPTRALDTEYRAFYDLLSAQVATAIHNATAAEQEKQRSDMLAELDRAKTTFFSNVSHEFRTPLTLMLGPTEDARAAGGALQGEALETVYRNELRLLKLVNALLDFSKLEAGRMSTAPEPLDLASFTIDLASGFRSAIERAGLTFEVETSSKLGLVHVDRDMWEKIVLNLLSNALKFTLQGGIRLCLRERGDQVELSVKDTGIGIPPHELPRLFERFHRVENPLARTHEGTGIGLALVWELTQLHKGTVSVESEVGRGTELTIAIPRLQEHAASPITPTPAPAAVRSAYVEEAKRWSVSDTPAEERPPGTGYVLIADDNADMREYLRRILAAHWRVQAVADGALALAEIQRERPDLVLTDVMMPRLDGFGLLAALRAQDSTRYLPVLLLSARAGDEASVEGLEAGADDYLVKPFSARELIARVRTHLTLSRLRRETEEASRAKDEFLAMLGHELRNPLAPIVTALHLMKLKGAGPTREQQTIERQVKHLTRLVDDLLDISRMTRGLIELKRESLLLSESISKALEIASPLLEQKGHHVSLTVPDTLWVTGDPIRLTQVFANLLTNAARYTPPGGHIDVTASLEPDHVVVHVRDDGKGVPQDMLTRIFDLFVQGQDTKEQGGLGIGLALVRNLVRMHGGTVTAYSAGTGQGSTFTVVLPSMVGPRALPTATPLPEGPTPLAQRVLLVDDNVDAADLLSDALRKMGHTVAVAYDGPHALVFAENFHPEVVVLDIGMPVMDGYELAQRLRESGFGGRMIALTGYGQERDLDRSREAGFHAHLVKPVSIERLVRAVARE